MLDVMFVHHHCSRLVQQPGSNHLRRSPPGFGAVSPMYEWIIFPEKNEDALGCRERWNVGQIW